jgi:hypothetical protein
VAAHGAFTLPSAACRYGAATDALLRPSTAQHPNSQQEKFLFLNLGAANRVTCGRTRRIHAAQRCVSLWCCNRCALASLDRPTPKLPARKIFVSQSWSRQPRNMWPHTAQPRCVSLWCCNRCALASLDRPTPKLPARKIFVSQSWSRQPRNMWPHTAQPRCPALRVAMVLQQMRSCVPRPPNTQTPSKKNFCFSILEPPTA